VWVCQHDKTKTPDRNDLILGTVVVLLDTVSKPTDFWVQKVGSEVRRTRAIFSRNFGTIEKKLIIAFYENYSCNLQYIA